MTFKTYEINVDLVNDASTTNTIRFSQNDRNSAKLLLTITNKGAELDLSQAKSVRMSFKKPDGTRVFQNDCQLINVLKGKYQILLKTQTLASVGNVIAQIHIEEEDRTIDTQKFLFVVNESLASDEAIESTNEFTIIQKAIEAGKKLEGKDIDAIIAAGELAKGAVKKSGDTMTGYLRMDTESGEKGIIFRDNLAEFLKVYTGKSRNHGLLDIVANKPIYEYNFANKKFNMLAETNLLKKSGDTMAGNLFFNVSNGNNGIIFKDVAANKNIVALDANKTGLSAWDSVNDKSIFDYNISTKKFTLNADSNLVTKTKDGRANLTLTADAINFDTNYNPLADRRGNTVTVRGAIGRTATSTSSLVTTLPIDMRPTLSFAQSTCATDGTPITILVLLNGEVRFINPSPSTTALGKNVFVSVTYVVD
ncbi:BppU family phage baseplate upper protein [Bacillus wiedmannii]|uniref:BppU family phage baseplate upper protein n=1 Tax=Bacillus wiedmannii TaxID=1890302 RepID=UPI000BF2043F|nr:BppU family phage baseplate upper protein [Bacillus wiedmannii]PEL80012.1 hypothetical protein CN609_19415 [Bacillus wiedmannii]